MADIRVEPEAPPLHQCWCIAVHVFGDQRQEIPCERLVPRDQPFCKDCEGRHADFLNDHLIVTTRPLPG